MKPHLIIIGLGNPGQSYTSTRHNVGFQALDVLSSEFGTGDWNEKQKFLCIAKEARIVTVPVLLVKPQTYMNRSGECVRKLVDFYKIDPASQILILCDDIDLPLGELRLRIKGGPGTHNGLRSIAEQFGEEYPRLRIGLGEHPTGPDLANWVLSSPPLEDAQKLQEAVKLIPGKVKEFVMNATGESDI